LKELLQEELRNLSRSHCIAMIVKFRGLRSLTP